MADTPVNAMTPEELKLWLDQNVERWTNKSEGPVPPTEPSPFSLHFYTDSTTKEVYYWNSTTWEKLGAGGSGLPAPYGYLVNAQGELVITQNGEPIQRLSKEGTWVKDHLTTGVGSFHLGDYMSIGSANRTLVWTNELTQDTIIPMGQRISKDGVRIDGNHIIQWLPIEEFEPFPIPMDRKSVPLDVTYNSNDFRAVFRPTCFPMETYKGKASLVLTCNSGGKTYEVFRVSDLIDVKAPNLTSNTLDWRDDLLAKKFEIRDQDILSKYMDYPLLQDPNFTYRMRLEKENGTPLQVLESSVAGYPYLRFTIRKYTRIQVATKDDIQPQKWREDNGTGWGIGSAFENDILIKNVPSLLPSTKYWCSSGLEGSTKLHVMNKSDRTYTLEDATTFKAAFRPIRWFELDIEDLVAFQEETQWEMGKVAQYGTLYHYEELGGNRYRFWECSLEDYPTASTWWTENPASPVKLPALKNGPKAGWENCPNIMMELVTANVADNCGLERAMLDNKSRYHIEPIRENTFVPLMSVQGLFDNKEKEVYLNGKGKYKAVDVLKTENIREIHKGTDQGPMPPFYTCIHTAKKGDYWTNPSTSSPRDIAMPRMQQTKGVPIKAPYTKGHWELHMVIQHRDNSENILLMGPNGPILTLWHSDKGVRFTARLITGEVHDTGLIKGYEEWNQNRLMISSFYNGVHQGFLVINDLVVDLPDALEDPTILGHSDSQRTPGYLYGVAFLLDSQKGTWYVETPAITDPVQSLTVDPHGVLLAQFDLPYTEPNGGMLWWATLPGTAIPGSGIKDQDGVWLVNTGQTIAPVDGGALEVVPEKIDVMKLKNVNLLAKGTPRKPFPTSMAALADAKKGDWWKADKAYQISTDFLDYPARYSPPALPTAANNPVNGCVMEMDFKFTPGTAAKAASLLSAGNGWVLGVQLGRWYAAANVSFSTLPAVDEGHLKLTYAGSSTKALTLEVTPKGGSPVSETKTLVSGLYWDFIGPVLVNDPSNPAPIFIAGLTIKGLSDNPIYTLNDTRTFNPGDEFYCVTDTVGTPRSFENFVLVPNVSSVMVGATATTDGAMGLTPAPKKGDQKKALLGDGTWGDVQITVDDKLDLTSVNPVQNKVLTAAMVDKTSEQTITGAKTFDVRPKLKPGLTLGVGEILSVDDLKDTVVPKVTTAQRIALDKTKVRACIDTDKDLLYRLNAQNDWVAVGGGSGLSPIWEAITSTPLVAGDFIQVMPDGRVSNIVTSTPGMQQNLRIMDFGDGSHYSDWPAYAIVKLDEEMFLMIQQSSANSQDLTFRTLTYKGGVLSVLGNTSFPTSGVTYIVGVGLFDTRKFVLVHHDQDGTVYYGTSYFVDSQGKVNLWQPKWLINDGISGTAVFSEPSVMSTKNHYFPRVVNTPNGPIVIHTKFASSYADAATEVAIYKLEEGYAFRPTAKKIGSITHQDIVGTASNHFAAYFRDIVVQTNPSGGLDLVLMTWCPGRYTSTPDIQAIFTVPLMMMSSTSPYLGAVTRVQMPPYPADHYNPYIRLLPRGTGKVVSTGVVVHRPTAKKYVAMQYFTWNGGTYTAEGTPVIFPSLGDSVGGYMTAVDGDAWIRPEFWTSPVPGVITHTYANWVETGPTTRPNIASVRSVSYDVTGTTPVRIPQGNGKEYLELKGNETPWTTWNWHPTPFNHTEYLPILTYQSSLPVPMMVVSHLEKSATNAVGRLVTADVTQFAYSPQNAIGIAQTTQATVGGNVDVILNGFVSNAHTNLTPGNKYYISPLGKLTTNATKYYAGTAITANSVLLNLANQNAVVTNGGLSNAPLAPQSMASTDRAAWTTASTGQQVFDLNEGVNYFWSGTAWIQM